MVNHLFSVLSWTSDFKKNPASLATITIVIGILGVYCDINYKGITCEENHPGLPWVPNGATMDHILMLDVFYLATQS